MTEYPVDVRDVAKALIQNLPEEDFVTGVLNESILYVSQKGSKRFTISWRKPQKTALWLEGKDAPLTAPLPGMILARTQNKEKSDYKLFALKTRKRPKAQDRLFVPPLPNTYNGGSICWGNVKSVPASDLSHTSLAADWDQLLGTKFNDHAVSGKCLSHKTDVRKLYDDLVQRKSRVYPVKELVKTKYTLSSLIQELKA